MKKSKTRELTRACLFSALLALLMGCNNDSSAPEPNPEPTFPEIKTTVIDDTKVPKEPVVGDVTKVPETDPKPPVTTGGEPSPIEGLLDTAASKGASRFIEVAPDTIGGQTFWSSPAYEYNLGNLVAVASGDSTTFGDGTTLLTPIHGWIRYPRDAIRPPLSTTFPVIILLHGNHSAADASYKGYDYLAEHLATHGYVVLSIDANAINGLGTRGVDPWAGDASSQSRAQLMLGTLDRLRQVNEQGQINPDGTPGALNGLKGKLDFSRIGIMGHSRGGQGVTNTILFNMVRRGTTERDLIAAVAAVRPRFSGYPDLTAAITTAGSVDEAKLASAITKHNIFFAAGSGNANEPPSYQFKGAFLLAPTDFGGSTGIYHVPLAVLLPSCDGDMAELQGAVAYDHNRFGTDEDRAPRYQIMVNGANHNDYNTIWTNDDFRFGRGPDFCLRDKNRTDSIRLSDEDQRNTGLFVINSFMRYHVGGEKIFATYWNGLAQVPEAACPKTHGRCDERFVLTVQKDGAKRKLIQRFGSGNSLTTNLLDGTINLSGFDDIARCEMPAGAYREGACTPKRLSGFEFNGGGVNGLRSIADHAELAWSKPKTDTQPVERAITTDLKDLSTKDFDSLTFRIAVVRPMGQEVLVKLTDTAGKSATVTASNFTNALYAPRRKAGDAPFPETPPAVASIGQPDPALGISVTAVSIGQPDPKKDIPFLDHMADAPYANGQVKILMNMVAIPLKAFEGIDLEHLKELKLAFPKESGKVAITDIELQNFGREQRLAEIALAQAGMLGGASGGIALGGNGGPPKSASGKPEDKLLIINH
ncbi:alpha/beta hydrolase family protein [Phyllobacterium zundukense]|uniref:Uncharacterized protein n=1 Tax=Phyllobacterium zundukense TaxID=1867719 RepID=A0ACD4D740_9HYPH|nr:hypothetical protein [Phyllobacterium zundukense]UXN61599.1 hypothetical protein N8E88_16190 [Phyllobacterium zundukense]